MSNDEGDYTLENVCVGRNFTFTSNAPGYIPETVAGVDGNFNVILEKIGTPACYVTLARYLQSTSESLL